MSTLSALAVNICLFVCLFVFKAQPNRRFRFCVDVFPQSPAMARKGSKVYCCWQPRNKFCTFSHLLLHLYLWSSGYMKKLFGYKCKLSLALLYLAYKFIDNFKTKRNGFFLQNGFNYRKNLQTFWRNVPATTKSMLLCLSARKRNGCSVICAPKL